MKVKSVDSYRDGGTLVVTFEDGTERFVDKRIDTPTPNALYAAYPKNGDSPIEGDHSMLVALIVALYDYKNIYKSERGDQRRELSTIEEVKAHKAKDKL